MRRRVVVTGAGGFVGSHLALGLAQLGFEPVLIDTAFDEEAVRRLGPLERVRADLSTLSDLPTDADYLIHGAALTASPAELGLGYAEHLEANTSLALAALRLAERDGMKRAVILSSAGVFTARQHSPLDEHRLPDATGAYATAKRIAELAAASVRTEGRLDAVTVRLGNLYGPGEQSRKSRPHLGLVQQLIRAATAGKPLCLSTPEALREWTFVGDLAPAIAKLLELPRWPHPVLHLASPETLTDRQVASEIARRLEAPYGPVPVLDRSEDDPQVRPPLRSRYSEALDLGPWTPFRAGLDQTLDDLPQTADRVSA